MIIYFYFPFSIVGILTGTTAPGQSRSGKNYNEEILHILQSSNTGASPSGGLVSYLGHSLGKGSYSSALMQSEYSIADTD